MTFRFEWHTLFHTLKKKKDMCICKFIIDIALVGVEILKFISIFSFFFPFGFLCFCLFFKIISFFLFRLSPLFPPIIMEPLTFKFDLSYIFAGSLHTTPREESLLKKH